MCVDRRDFLRLAASAAGGLALSADEMAARAETDAARNATFAHRLQPQPGKVVPISDDERRARIAKAQALMSESRIDAIYLEGSSSLFYYTGVRWWNGERMFVAVIPARGEIA